MAGKRSGAPPAPVVVALTFDVGARVNEHPRLGGRRNGTVQPPDRRWPSLVVVAWSDGERCMYGATQLEPAQVCASPSTPVA